MAAVPDRKPCGRGGPGHSSPCRWNTAEPDCETAPRPHEECRSTRFRALEDVSSLSSCRRLPVQMKPAFLFARLPPPASGAAVFAGLHSSRAWRTADAGISAVVKSIVGNAIRFDVRPDVVGRPLEQRIEFQQAVRVIPAFGLKVLPIR